MTLPIVESTGREERASPEYVRISYASALALRFKSGRFVREFDFGGINLLLNYEVGCQSDCGYCGLARSRSEAWRSRSPIASPSCARRRGRSRSLAVRGFDAES